MLILSEKKLRQILREEFERLMSPPQKTQDIVSMKSLAGGEIIMPNFVKERFDEGKIKSLADII